MEIRAKSERVRQILHAASIGDINFLLTVNDHDLKTSYCNSGCTAVHWAAGKNAVAALKHLILDRKLFAADIKAIKKSHGRTPLHYSCRNGCLEATGFLVEQCQAETNPKAKHGVTPFQLAVWQNQLPTCKYLVNECNVSPNQVNDFDCGAIHWLGICPTNRANCLSSSSSEKAGDEDGSENGIDLLPLAGWLSDQPGMDFQAKQRQGHTALHKAAWGGHLALCEYLRTKHNLWDDSIDDAGNHAADLADMADTEKHNVVARYLRKHCSRSRAESCQILGLDPSCQEINPHVIRKAYLVKARQFHPDQTQRQQLEDGGIKDAKSSTAVPLSFDTIRKAYIHLTEENGHGDQSNPAHSLNLMLQVNGLQTQEKGYSRSDVDGDAFSCFKARLVAVLLEYGSKGIDLSNIKKKWKQVWPKVPFPTTEICDKSNIMKTVSLSEFLKEQAGDVIKLVQDENTGVIKAFPKNCSQDTVVAAVADASR